MRKHEIALAALLAAALGACSFGNRSIELGLDRPTGEPEIFRGISVVLETPEDLRPEPHWVVGSVRSGAWVKTADITTSDDVREWVRQAMTSELQHAGFLVAPAANPGRALHVRTNIVELMCVESIGFGASLVLDLRVSGDATLLLEKSYTARDYHVVITHTSGRKAADSLRACLKEILAQFVQDLSAVVDASPE
jgi:hypothetical protein